jgi:ketopantoate reductase
MRFVIIGAGAVGVTLGAALEHMKHEVMYLVRPGRRQELTRFILVNASTGKPHRRERPTVYELGNKLPPHEWALLCMRGEQLEAGLETLREHVRPGARVGLGAAHLRGLEMTRAAWKGGPVVEMLPLFAAWGEDKDLYYWFQPPLVKTLVSGEGDAAADAAAGELAGALDAAGVPSRAVGSLRRSVVPMLAPGMVLMAGWELCGWDVERLGRDKEVRGLTAAAMGEAAALVRGEVEGAARWVMHLPAPAMGLLLRALPRLSNETMRRMWSYHGPKLRRQTREMLDELIARAETAGTVRLRELRGRLPAV